MKAERKPSPCRLLYLHRFFFRLAVLAASIALYIFAPAQLDILRGFSCFEHFSVFDLLWLIWEADMVMQLVRCPGFWPLGSQKYMAYAYDPAPNVPEQSLRRYVRRANRGAAGVAAAWGVVVIACGALYFLVDAVDDGMLLLFTVFFFFCDVFCVVVWCPFRALFMKNRCCTVCRIFNWDHIMMFLPLVLIPGFYTWSLVLSSLAVLVVWELSFKKHPERFWDGTNRKLRCAGCTDRLCGEKYVVR